MSSHMTRQSLGSDLDTLLQASNPLLALINSSATPKPAQSSLSLLDSYTPSTKDHDASQALAEAYARDMRGNVLSMDQGDGEKLGARIDEIRGKAEGIIRALEDVNVQG